ncbi:MAG TPA: STAS domain-containing protein [Solirubrobacterales bacterium]|jgi:anti-anti-sigma factor|nr:STAS domain-containing protein [Solirubrobacterales bacterium]
MGILKLSERRLASGALEIEVDGELDLSVAGQLQEAIDRAESGPTLIDLARCTFIDSTGIAVVLRANQLYDGNGGGRVVLHSPSDQVLRVFTVTGLTGDGLIFPAREEAIAALER